MPQNSTIPVPHLGVVGDTPQTKLVQCSLAQLRILAMAKKIKGYSKFNREELIYLMTDFVSEKDFPVVADI